MAKISYGIPYVGSKNLIIKDIMNLFPPAENFYDLFGGGFSVTHYALINKRNDYKYFHFNELRSEILQLIKDAISGKYNYNSFTPKFVSHDEFYKNRGKDIFTDIVWSFSNNCRSYIYSKKNEAYKRSMHNAIVFNEFDNTAEQVLGIRKFDDKISIKDRRFFQIQHLERIERFQNLEAINGIKNLKFYNSSYDEVPIKENSIIYCDPPYKGVEGAKTYKTEFDTEKFLDWAAEQKNPVFISEYNIDDNRFKCIFEKEKKSFINIKKKERIYINKYGLKYLNKHS